MGLMGKYQQETKQKERHDVLRAGTGGDGPFKRKGSNDQEV